MQVGGLDTIAVHEGAVGADAIRDLPPIVFKPDVGVHPRACRVVQHQRAALVSTHEIVAAGLQADGLTGMLAVEHDEFC